MTCLPLFLNDVSGSEVVVIMLVILIFFGSKSIPGIAKTVGKALYQIRNASSELQNEIKKSGAEITKDINLKDILTEKQEELLAPMDQIYSDIDNTMHYDGIKERTSNNSQDLSEQSNIEPSEEIKSNDNNPVKDESSSNNNG